MKRVLTAVALLAALASCPAFADGHALTLNEADARETARQALNSGDHRISDAIASALLERNPEDADAWMIRALSLRGLGQLDEARATAMQAWQYGDQLLLRYEAAYLVADILARQERYSRSQFWLRRADQVAPDDARRQLVARAFASVRKRNPLQVQLRFSLKPSNNVNNGAETTVIEIGGLPFRLDDSGVQLGGWEGAAGLSFGYRQLFAKFEVISV